MNMIPQTITLSSDQHFGSKAPSEGTGNILRLIQPTARQAIRMAFEGRSESRGSRPGWLIAASDIRFAGVSGDDDTILHFEVPQLGEAAEQIYAQQQLWPGLPDPSKTGFDLLAVVAHEIRTGKQDSVRFDRQLLKSLSKFGRSLDGTFSQLLIGADYQTHKRGIIDCDLLQQVQIFQEQTPSPQPGRIAGRLDMIRSSTQSFALKLATGEEVRAILLHGDVTDLLHLFKKEVLVLGKVVFRPSGQVLRIDADEVIEASKHHQLFAKMPKPRAQSPAPHLRQASRQNENGLKGIIGKWPGDESEEEIRRILQEIS